jgi:L,D-peptidoglycan transpeptidase YkuD (ErfK/YbiS/YcfS/YnhG family)
MNGQLTEIRVIPLQDQPGRGRLVGGTLETDCALGRSGLSGNKREGDGATPSGTLALVEVLYRPDRGPAPKTRLPVHAIDPADGWCDDPADPNYNRKVRLPYPGRHERLWRSDRLYDLIAVLDYNLACPVPGLGSAIFLHVAAPDLSPTDGCVAVPAEVMPELLNMVGAETRIRIG